MSDRRRQERWVIAKIAGFSIWMAVVATILLWQAAHYNGFLALVGEWQFDLIGRQYPTFNYVMLVFLLCLPGYLLFLRPRDSYPSESVPAAMLRSARALMRGIIGVTAGLAMAALIFLIAMLMLPTSNGTPQQIDLSRPMLSPPAEGPATLSGVVLYERTAGLDDDLLVARKQMRFAPMVSSNDSTNEVQFFVQLPPVDERTRSGATTMTGVLKRDGLPGELVRLFRYAGFHLADPHYVLFIEPAAMRWPYITALVQLVIGSLLALGLALFQVRRVRRIDHVTHEPHAVAEPAV